MSAVPALRVCHFCKPTIMPEHSLLFRAQIPPVLLFPPASINHFIILPSDKQTNYYNALVIRLGTTL